MELLIGSLLCFGLFCFIVAGLCFYALYRLAKADYKGW